MPIDDPNTWLQGATALKAGFDAFRSAIAVENLLASPQLPRPNQASQLDTPHARKCKE